MLSVGLFLRFAQGRKLGEKLVEAGRLEDHQAACRAAGRQIERVQHAWRNMHAACFGSAAIQSPST